MGILHRGGRMQAQDFVSTGGELTLDLEAQAAGWQREARARSSAQQLYC